VAAVLVCGFGTARVFTSMAMSFILSLFTGNRASSGGGVRRCSATWWGICGAGTKALSSMGRHSTGSRSLPPCLCSICREVVYLFAVAIENGCIVLNMKAFNFGLNTVDAFKKVTARRHVGRLLNLRDGGAGYIAFARR